VIHEGESHVSEPSSPAESVTSEENEEIKKEIRDIIGSQKSPYIDIQLKGKISAQ
jgi:hypothetical protein